MDCSEGRDNEKPQYTDHCFTGEYPTGLADYENEKIQGQLSLLADDEN
jgi:amidophosphoribosyltransferase